MALIETAGIGRRFVMGAETVTALEQVSLSISEGESVAIMGPSGSGKSTFMNVLGCLDRPSSGSYRLAGEEVSTLTSAELAGVRNRRIGFVFQQFNLLPRATALENVALPMLYAGLPRSQRLDKARLALGRVGLGERLFHRPLELSGGQQQRVAIARALVNDPAVILADEPTGALDSVTSLEIMALFQSLNAQGATLILVTHEADVAAHAGRVVHFLDGRLQADVRHAPLNAAEALAIRRQGAAA